jgi:adenylate cyclase
LPEQEVAIRGRAELMMVHPVADARTLSALVDDLNVAAA